MAQHPSKSPGSGFVVTKLPSIYTRLHPESRKLISAARRPSNSITLRLLAPNRAAISGQLAGCIPAGKLPPGSNGGIIGHYNIIVALVQAVKKILSSRQAAVDGEDGAGDELGIVGREIEGH